MEGGLDLGYVRFPVGPDALVTQEPPPCLHAVSHTRLPGKTKKVRDLIGLSVSDHPTQPEGVRLNH